MAKQLFTYSQSVLPKMNVPTIRDARSRGTVAWLCRYSIMPPSLYQNGHRWTSSIRPIS